MVERIQLVSDDVIKERDLKTRVLQKDINKDNFHELDLETQEKVKNILFDISTETIDANEGASTLEFILMAYMRISMKKINGQSLNSEDVQVEKELSKILAMHDITNGTAKKDWLFDYMSYAQYKTDKFLGNRRDHIARKKDVTGQV